MLSEKYRQGMAELLAILSNIDDAYVKKIPNTLMNYFKRNASKDYKVSFDSSKSLKDLNLKRETDILLSMLYLNYWCEPEEQKEFINLLKDNQEKKYEMIRKNYNPNSPFLEKNNIKEIHESSKIDKSNIENSNESTSLPSKYKENIIQKFINKLKSIFAKR